MAVQIPPVDENHRHFLSVQNRVLSFAKQRIDENLFHRLQGFEICLFCGNDLTNNVFSLGILVVSIGIDRVVGNKIVKPIGCCCNCVRSLHVH